MDAATHDVKTTLPKNTHEQVVVLALWCCGGGFHVDIDHRGVCSTTVSRIRASAPPCSCPGDKGPRGPVPVHRAQTTTWPCTSVQGPKKL